ncbi:MAG TPA: alpha/beta hydrolase [Propionicimonas sp.]|jgi:pimeloyl-ACP methyl ester carboxylesterase
MAYVMVGDGPRTVLIMPGGPGSMLPSGPMAMMLTEDWKQYLAAGYRVCFVTRPRNMPIGHSIADMADDHARFIREELGGRVDLVVGKSYGGLIAFYLAANHPEVARFVVAAGAAATVPEVGKEVDRRWARLRAEGRHTEAALVMLEFMMPGARAAFLRRLAAPVMGALFATLDVPPGDLLVEAEAECAFDAHDVLEHLRRIQVPMLLVYGEADEYIPRSAFDETAAHIPDCTVVSYPGVGHRAVMSSRVPQDVLTWATQRGTVTDPATPDRERSGA